MLRKVSDLRAYIPFLVILGLCLGCVAAEVSAQPKQDVLIVTVVRDGGCYSISLLNGNAQSLGIDQIRLRILTPGFLWHSRIKPPVPWVASLPVPETVSFTTTGAPVAPGGRLLLNNICLSMVCQTPATVEVLWETFNSSTLLTSDTLSLVCEPFDTFDEVRMRDSSGTALITLLNRNSGPVALDAFTVSSLTPGVTMNARVHNGWIVKNSTSTSARFEKSIDPLLAGDSLPGFSITPVVGAVPPPHVFAWSTEWEGRIITLSSLRLGKVAPRCDSLRLHSFLRPPEGSFNAYGATLRNLHEPAGPIDRLEFELRTPGTAFKDSASGPWAVSFPNKSRLRFTAGAAPLQAGDSLAGLSFAMTNAGATDSVVLIARTWYQGSFICADTLVAYCPPTEFIGCDNLALAMDSSCTSNIFLSNRHVPVSPVDAFVLEMLPGAEDILSAIAPTGWRVDSAGGSYVRFVHEGGGIAPGEVSLALRVAFSANRRGQPFGVRWSSWYGGRRICEEDRVIMCQLPAGGCDSLQTDFDGKRSFLYNVTNTHQPPSPVLAISFRIVSANGSLQQMASPAAWTADSIASDYIRFVHTGGGVLPGAESGEFYLKYTENTGSSVSMQWCTEDAASVICCQSIDVALPEWRIRDSLEIAVDAAACAANLTLHNMHSAERNITMFSVALLSADREIDTAYAPVGWQIVRSGAGSVSFVSAGASLPPGSGQDGFWIQLVPDTSTAAVDFEWCTWSSSTLIGCGLASMRCGLLALGCDSVVVVTDPSASCCFSLEVLNLRSAGTLVDSVRLRVLTPDVVLYQSTVESPIGWISGGTETEVAWSTATIPIAYGVVEHSFRVCFDNDAIANADFDVEVATYDLLEASCIDTFRISCDVTLSVADMPGEAGFALGQNYPNPFNPVTTIIFALRDAGHVTLGVLDARGRVLATLAAGYHAAGTYRIPYDAGSMPSGVYFARLRVDGRVQLRAMTLLR